LLTYLLIDFFSFIFPFLFSFETKMVNFRKYWKPLVFALLIQYVFMISWDHLFTVMNVWSFSKDYTIGFDVWEMPIEEHIFFLAIPYSCFFIYEILNKYVKDYLKSFSLVISLLLVAVFVLIIWNYYDKLYTATASLLSLYLLLNHILVFRSHKRYLGRFYMAYLVVLIPFFIVNGLLTSLPVVMYNATSNIGIRIWTIPIEDFIYNFFMLLLIATVYESLKKKFGLSQYPKDLKKEEVV
jgi:lycopene cyclase domain-containing protein